MTRAVDLRKLGIVARFELAEALRSRLVAVVLALYGVGAGLGVYILSRMLEAAEAAVRDSMLGTLSAHAVPDDVVREVALPRVISFLVKDEELQKELLAVEPLAIFYGFMALMLVAPLVLVTSGSAHAADVASGSTRFVLVRCDRLSWSLGKLVGHALLLALGLVVGAFATAVVAHYTTGFDLESGFWLLRAAFRAWVYGLAYLGIFSGIALLTRAPARARAASVAMLFWLWVGHTVCESSLVAARVPFLSHLVWFFPSQYELLLWSPSAFDSIPATLALMAIAGSAFALGYARFRRADA